MSLCYKIKTYVLRSYMGFNNSNKKSIYPMDYYLNYR